MATSISASPRPLSGSSRGQVVGLFIVMAVVLGGISLSDDSDAIYPNNDTCSDGLDNDGDGFIDLDDDECWGPEQMGGATDSYDGTENDPNNDPVEQPETP